MAAKRDIGQWAGALLGLAIVGTLPASADLITLKDGRTLSGIMTRRGDVVTIDIDGGGTVRVKPDDVTRTTLISRVTPEEAANAEWTRRAALIRQAADLDTIIDLHRTFLDKFGDAAVSVTVRASLADYALLQKQHGVKFRGRWMPAAQVDVTLRQWEQRAAPALALYRAGQLRPALDTAKKIADQDAANSNALTVAGLASYRLNDLLGAIDYFSALAEADPGNVLAENNLGVILFLVKREPESLVHYARALETVPANRLVADNIAEAIHDFTGNRSGAAYEKLLRQYEQAEIRLETDMAKNGLYRYGSTWVAREQLSAFTATLQSIQTDMARLDAQYQSSQRDGQTIIDQVKQATDDYNSTLATLQYLNSTLLEVGGDSAMIARRAAIAADLERLRLRKSSLEAQRDALVSGTPQMFAEAARLKAALAAAEKAQFGGIQRIMDIGEAEHPPAPMIVTAPAPRPLPAPPVVIQQSPPIIVDNSDDYQRIYSTGATIFTPIFVSPPGGHHHGGHDGNDNPGPIRPVNPPLVAPTGPRAPSFDGSTSPSGPVHGHGADSTPGNGR